MRLENIAGKLPVRKSPLIRGRPDAPRRNPKGSFPRLARPPFNPFDMGYADPLAELEQVPNLSPQEREQIRTRTARALLGES